MESLPCHGPQYPAQEGAVISRDPDRNVSTQSVPTANVTCVREQQLSPGLLPRQTTGDSSASTPTPSASQPTTASQPVKRSTPVMVGPPPLVPSRPTPASLRRRERKRARKARLALAGPSHTQAESVQAQAGPVQPVPSTSQQMMEVSEGASDAGELESGKPLSSDSERTGTDSVSEVTSEEEGMLLASPSGQAAAEAEPTSLVPANVASKETSGKAAGGKRKTEAGPTPPQTKRKKAKKGPPFGSTFEQAEKDNLLGVVLIRDNHYTVLTKPQLDYVTAELMKRLEETVDSNDGQVPQFEEHGIRYGRFHLSCTNSHLFMWLARSIASISVPASDDTHSLELVTSSEVPKLLRAEVFISGPPPGVPKFKKLIQAQNAGLYVDRWVLRHQQQTSNSMLMVWNIDKPSADALEAVDYRPHFGLGRVTFKVSRGSDPGGK